MSDEARRQAITAWWERQSIRALIRSVRDSGSDRNGEGSRSEAECEASQSGAEGNRPESAA